MNWISKLSWFVYIRDLEEILVIIACDIVVWAILGVLLSKKKSTAFMWEKINFIFGILMIVVILCLTMFSRNANGGHEVCLIPFYSFVLAKENEEIYRSMLMNVFLFEPIGITIPFAMPSKLRQKTLITIVGSCILSIIIESIQYIFYLGRAEIDDIICNTLGCAIGTCAYLLYRKYEIMQNITEIS